MATRKGNANRCGSVERRGSSTHASPHLIFLSIDILQDPVSALHVVLKITLISDTCTDEKESQRYRCLEKYGIPQLALCGDMSC
jgi:hypothetical protein